MQLPWSKKVTATLSLRWEKSPAMCRIQHFLRKKAIWKRIRIPAIVRRYVEQDTWKTDLIFSEDAFVLLQDILEEGGELTNRVAYEDLVNTEFAKKALER